MNHNLAVRELQQMAGLVKEYGRSRDIWQNEYLRIAAFFAADETKVRGLTNMAHRVSQMLDMQPIQNQQIADAMTAIDQMLKLCKGIDIRMVQPEPSLTEAASVATFMWYLDMDLGITVAPKNASTGEFLDEKIQALWDGWRLGAKFGFAEAQRLAKVAS